MKRFNFVNNRWVKSQKVVNFPFKDFDPTPYLASVPQETILRHKELLEHQSTQKTLNNDQSDDDVVDSADHSVRHNIGSIQENSVLAEAVVNQEIALTSKQGTVKAAFEQDQRRRSITNHNGISPTKRGGCVGGSGETGTGRRKRLVSTSLTKTPVIDGEFTDFHNHQLIDGEDPYNLNYQLYAVVVNR